MLLYQEYQEEPKVTHIVLTDVTEEVLSVTEAKSFMAIDFPDFDETLAGIFIPAIREAAERYTGLSIGTREIQLSGDFTDPEVYMPYAPVISIDDDGKQVVGYTADTVPAGLKLAMLTILHDSFENRVGHNFNLKPLDLYRRRVGI